MSAKLVIDPSRHPLVAGCPPEWASEWGQDRHGGFIAFTLAEGTQRLRWIPPGRFMMGSPEEEPGRYDDEGPQHPVFITKGFFVSDTLAITITGEGVKTFEFRGGDKAHRAHMIIMEHLLA